MRNHSTHLALTHPLACIVFLFVQSMQRRQRSNELRSTPSSSAKVAPEAAGEQSPFNTIGSPSMPEDEALNARAYALCFMHLDALRLAKLDFSRRLDVNRINRAVTPPPLDVRQPQPRAPMPLLLAAHALTPCPPLLDTADQASGQ